MHEVELCVWEYLRHAQYGAVTTIQDTQLYPNLHRTVNGSGTKCL